MGQHSVNRDRRQNGIARPPVAPSAPAGGASQQVRADERASDDGMAESPRADAMPSHDDISQAAYLLSEARGFEAGGEVNDWLSAESSLRGSRST